MEVLHLIFLSHGFPFNNLVNVFYWHHHKNWIYLLGGTKLYPFHTAGLSWVGLRCKQKNKPGSTWQQPMTGSWEPKTH